MDAFDDRARRDFIVALAWALTTLWLRLCAGLALPVRRLMPTRQVASGRRGRPFAEDQTPSVRSARGAGRGVCGREPVAGLRRGAEAARADAELACGRAGGEFGALRDPEPASTVRGADPMAA